VAAGDTFSYAEDRARAMHFNAVAESNTPAIALCRSLGFEVLATIPEAFLHPSEGHVGRLVMNGGSPLSPAPGR
jgi:ribosomal protein S18 acetylase RimI-like enzyme